MGAIANNPFVSLQSNLGAPQVIYLSDGVAIFPCVSSPEGVIAANRGSLALDVTNGAIYLKTTNTVNTGWAALATGSGLTINPTTNVIPVKSGASSFGDSKISQSGNSTIITSSDAAAIAIGRQGATNPAVAVDASVASCVTGLLVTPRAGNGGLTVAVTSTANDESVQINAKGLGGIHLNKASGGAASVHIGSPSNAVPGLRVDAGGSSTDVAQFSVGGNVSSGAYVGVAGLGTLFQVRTADTANGGTLTLDSRAGNFRQVTVNVNSTITMSNIINSSFFAILVVQPAAGGKTLTWNAVFKWPTGTPPALTATANAKDLFLFVSDGTNIYNISQQYDLA